MNDDGAVEPLLTPGPSSAPGLASSRPSNKRKSDPFERDIINILKSNVQQTPNCQDTDEMFLLSQIPFIRKLKPSDKLDFQIRFMQLLQSYSAHSQPPSPSHSLCNTSPISITIPSHNAQNSSAVVSQENIAPLEENNVISDDESIISFFNM